MKKIISLVALLFILGCSQDLGILGDTHIHADFLVVLDGGEIDFEKENYMSDNTTKLSNFLHLHDLDGGVIHQHITGVNLGDFFATLNMSVNDSCFTFEAVDYCNDENSVYRMFVNSRSNSKFGDYYFRDLDKILIYHGPNDETLINQYVNKVSNRACLYSGTCPERGVAPAEAGCSTDGGCSI